MVDTLEIARARARYEALIEHTSVLLEIAANSERAWRKTEDERSEAFKTLVNALEAAQSPEAAIISGYSCDPRHL